jgi:hypothetical protein
VKAVAIFLVIARELLVAEHAVTVNVSPGGSRR